MKGLRIICLAAAVGASLAAVAAADPPAGAQLRELQGTLAALQARLDALVKQGDAAR